MTVQLGRQRWRSRGRIRSEEVQSWEEEHAVFLPHIRHNFEIKVGLMDLGLVPGLWPPPILCPPCRGGPQTPSQNS